MNEIKKGIGLTEAEVENRRKKFGYNILRERKKVSAVKIFMQQFNDFITWVLIAATLISGAMGEKADAITILIIVIMNSILGFIQEFKTEKSLEALKELTSPTAKVYRNNRVKVIRAELLVPGDVLLVESGDRISSDCILIESNNLKVDESLLTGESEGVQKELKDGNNKIYMGTTVINGFAKAKVIAIGMNTEMGKIAKMIESIEDEKSPLKDKLNSLGKILVLACLVICFVVTVMGILRGHDKYEMFLLGVSLAVAAIPEGLSAIVTVSLALGVGRMLKRNALVRKLPAVETLGCTSVICSDKTGTLTQNKMTVQKIYFDRKNYSVDSRTKRKLLDLNNDIIAKSFVSCSDFTIEEKNKKEIELKGDPTEIALVKAFFIDKNRLMNFMNNGKRVYEIPFDSDRKMKTVVTKEKGKLIGYTNGAPEKLLGKCKFIWENNGYRIINQGDKKAILDQINKMSSEALRCLGTAFSPNINRLNKKSFEENLVFIGLAGMKDPPRKEVKDAVLKCKLAGVKPVMITGDHKNTAYAIAKELNICRNENEVITGEELDKLKESELTKKCRTITVFSRVTPAHKLKIVSAFKKNGNIVAMTGDGVNDAPAVKEADIGISMGISGTDVTKESSSMILLDDNFSTIVAAVEEGRVIYDNIRKFIRYLLACNIGEVLTMFIASIININVPLLPIQILFVNLATDGLPAIALGVDPADKDIMKRKPINKNESIFARGLKEMIIIRGVLIGVCTILAFLFGKYFGMNLIECRTITLGTLIMSQLFHVFECRSENHSIFEINIFSNVYLIGSVAVSITMLISIIYVPFLQNVFHTVTLDAGQWLIVLFFSGVIFMTNSLYLLLANKNKK
ncbi:calcium-translocating P-type ATPase, PMCA-type [Clostridium sp. DL1XJH146]